MSNPHYRIIMMTSDNYLDAARIGLHLIDKYWIPHVPVLLVGFKPPQYELPDYVEFMSLGDMQQYPISKWSDALIETLHRIDDQQFVLMLDDYYITRPVDTRNVGILIDYLGQFGYVLKIDLATDRLYAHGADLGYGNVAWIDLVKSMPGSDYHMSLWIGAWRKDNLLKVLKPNETPWDVELIGTTRLSHMQDLIVLGTRNIPIQVFAGLRGQDTGKLILDGLKQEDIEELRNLGLLKPWEQQ